MAPTRPATISELAAAAATADADQGPPRELKHYLRQAELRRRDAKALALGTGGSNGAGSGGTGAELERAFIEYARAATLILERIPNHRDYVRFLTQEQRENLTANGEDILHQLGRLKSALVDRYERYKQSPHARADAVPAFMQQSPSSPTDSTRTAQSNTNAQPTYNAHPAMHMQAQRAAADEAAQWRAQREASAARDAANSLSSNSSYASSASSIYASSASSAANSNYPTYTSSASAYAASTSHAPSTIPVPVSLAASYQGQKAQPAALPPSFRGASSSLSSASAAASYGYGNGYGNGGGGGGGGGVAGGGGNQASGGYSAGQSASENGGSTHTTPTPGPLPLRPSTSEYEYDGESTDSEGGAGAGWRARHNHPHPQLSYPAPPIITTTSPPPFPTATHASFAYPSADGQQGYAGVGSGGGYGGGGNGAGGGGGGVGYPTLPMPMSSHQRTQGYVPSAWSMFSLQAALPGDNGSSASTGNTDYGGGGGGGADGGRVREEAALGAARAAAASTAYASPSSASAGSGMGFGPLGSVAPAPAPRLARQPSLGTYIPLGRPPPAPSAPPPTTSSTNSGAGAGGGPGIPRLRTVVLPRATLPRFLAIASANTARNLETCGLLLGREVVRDPPTPTDPPKARYVVSTLLVPKQHATSDTCTMDEEEGVLGFTEARGLITLGWIHTHPSQSCFMSSVDLHTHASFQRMLPESFAVVCAPKSDPNFGIFRLTDPPGLQTVLKCTAKQAFHPHPDVPIYTDADKGHVQMRDAALEIVDLR